MSNPKTVKFRNADMYWDIAADIYFPPGFDDKKTYPAIITAHPIGSCKEQTAGNVYGKALAEAGFVAIAFDRSTQGASGGEPRYIEDPVMAVEDIRRVVDYLVTQPYVDADRIGILGICGGGGYVLNATMTERRIKAVASITGVNYGRLCREGFTGFDPIGQMEAMAKQRTAEARGAALRVDDLLPESPEAAKKAGIKEIDVLGATDYYRTDRGRAPHGLNRALYSHQAAAIGWDAFHLCEALLTQPLMVVVGDQVVIEGWSHYDLYDKPEPVGQALAKLVPFYKQYL